MKGKGVQVNVFFFPPPFDMWKEEGKGVFFFLKLFFHCLMAREGGSWVFFNIYVEGEWEGEGVEFFYC